MKRTIFEILLGSFFLFFTVYDVIEKNKEIDDERNVQQNAIIIHSFEKDSSERSMILLDPRDGKGYKIIKIGRQLWMAENLNYEYNNKSARSSCYDDDLKNCFKYGRLYNWKAAQNVCPQGWHLPSKDEFETLFEYVGGSKLAGKHLKSANDWIDYEEESRIGSDSYGFRALPAGDGDGSGHYTALGVSTSFWSSSQDSLNRVLYASMVFASNAASCVPGIITNRRYSVRCLKD